MDRDFFDRLITVLTPLLLALLLYRKANHLAPVWLSNAAITGDIVAFFTALAGAIDSTREP